MTAEHHDLVLGITSHLPHLIAYTIVGTADELGEVTRSEVLKFSAGGFRDFTRIAASDPTMWRDVFLANKDAVLEMLGRFNEDLSALTRAIRRGDGDALFEHFTRTRAIRRGIVADRPGFARARFRPRRIRACRPSRCRGPTRPTTSSRSSIRTAAASAPSLSGPSDTTPSSKRSGSATARLPSSSVGWPSRLMPATIAGPAFCARRCRGRHDAVERAERAVDLLAAPARCASMRSRPSAGRNFSRPATVSAKLAVEPAGRRQRRARRRDRDRLALLHARACRSRSGRRPPDFAKALGPGLGRKILQPAQHRGDVGIDRLGGRPDASPAPTAATSLSATSITGWSGTVPETRRPSTSMLVRLEQRCPPPRTRSTDRLVDHDRDALGRRRQAVHARLRALSSWRSGSAAWPGSATSAAPTNSLDQQGRLLDLRGDSEIALALSASGGWLRFQLGAGSAQRTSMRNGKPPSFCDRAGIDAAGPRLALLPACDRSALGALGGVVPEAAPARRQARPAATTSERPATGRRRGTGFAWIMRRM